ncbi:MAG: hypothetical protein QOG82_722 [Actinomycetota bacterium]|nr:hypothetical protein [Actinomycetota bacterium]
MRSYPPSRRLAVGLAVVTLLLLASCTTIRGLIDTEEALGRAGFTDIDVSFSSDEGFDQVEVVVRPPSVENPDASAEEAARVVWTNFPLRFDLLRVELLGTTSDSGTAFTTYTSSEMAEIFGPRDPGLDEKELGDDVVRAGLGVAVVLAVGGLLFTAAIVLAIVFGVRASRRRASATPLPWPPVPRA